LLQTKHRAAASNLTTGRAARAEIGTLARALLVAALTLTLVVALRWAVNVTNANTRRVSTNLVRLQGRFGQQNSAGVRSAPAVSDAADKQVPAPTIGPSIDPIETAPGR
jgi:hypothetical protein